MKISEGLSVLEISRPEGYSLSPVLLYDDKNVILFDAGLPGQLEIIKSAISDEGSDFSKLNLVLITHHDMDHIGSLAAIKKENPNVKIMTSTGEKDYVQYDKLPAKTVGERLKQVVLDYEEKTGTIIKKPVTDESAKILYANYITSVDEVLEDGQELSYCGGIIVIHTPGHTPGHCCYYLKKYRALITGDALNVEAGQLSGPNPIHTKDLVLAFSSLKKLSNYKIDCVLCYHGGYLSSPVGMNSAINFLL